MKLLTISIILTSLLIFHTENSNTASSIPSNAITLSNDIDKKFIENSKWLSTMHDEISEYQWTDYVPNSYNIENTQKFIKTVTNGYTYSEAIKDCHSDGSQLLAFENNEDWIKTDGPDQPLLVWQTLDRPVGGGRPTQGRSNPVRGLLGKKTVDYSAVSKVLQQNTCVIFDMTDRVYKSKKCTDEIGYMCQIRKEARLNQLREATPYFNKIALLLNEMEEIQEENAHSLYKPLTKIQVDESLVTEECKARPQQPAVSEYLNLQNLFENLKRDTEPLNQAPYIPEFYELLKNLKALKSADTSRHASLKLFSNLITFSEDKTTICFAPNLQIQLQEENMDLNNYVAKSNPDFVKVIELHDKLYDAYENPANFEILKNHIWRQIKDQCIYEAKIKIEKFTEEHHEPLKTAVTNLDTKTSNFPNEWDLNIGIAIDDINSEITDKLNEKQDKIDYKGKKFTTSVKAVIWSEFKEDQFYIDFRLLFQKELEKPLFENRVKALVKEHLTEDDEWKKTIKAEIYKQCSVKCKYEEKLHNEGNSDQRKTFTRENLLTSWWGKDALDLIVMAAILGIMALLLLNMLNLLCYQCCHSHGRVNTEEITELTKTLIKQYMDAQEICLGEEPKKENKNKNIFLGLFRKRSKSVSFAEDSSRASTPVSVHNP